MKRSVGGGAVSELCMVKEEGGTVDELMRGPVGGPSYKLPT